MSLRKWTTVDELDTFLAGKETGFLLKHSTRCPISASAYRQFDSFAEKDPSIPSYLVLVVEDRPVSNAVAQKLGVRHASPQAILVRDGLVVWQASHGEITEDTLSEAWAESIVE